MKEKQYNWHFEVDKNPPVGLMLNVCVRVYVCMRVWHGGTLWNVSRLPSRGVKLLLSIELILFSIYFMLWMWT